MNRLQIIKDGQCNYSIVVPKDASLVEENAARELSQYFVKTANAHLKQCDEIRAKGPCFYIGHTDFAKINGIEGKSEENWQIAVCGENVVLTGGVSNMQRGISYAVYHFIEDYMGVRWWNEVEEYVPQIKDFSLPADLKTEGTPTFVERKIVSSFANYDFTYLAHNRINLISNGDNVVGRQFARTAIETGGVHYVGLPAMCHTMDLYYPPNEYFEEHPDWYGWDNAEQRRRGDFQMCFSNEGLFENLLERLLYNIETELRAAKHYNTAPPSCYSITVGDHQRHCQCPACTASIKKSGLSGHHIKFTNKLAREVAKVYPDVFLETLAYWDYFDTPLDDTRPDKNVILRIADMLVDVAHDIYYPTNKHKLETLKKWGKICQNAGGGMWHWDYMFHDFPNFPMPAMYMIPTNLRAYHEMGIDSLFIENEVAALSDFWCCNQWLLCKYAENPYIDFDAALTDFLTKYYGEGAAPYLREYLDLAHEACEASGMRIMLFQSCSNWNYVSPELLNKGIELFGKAFAAAKGNKIYEQRLREAEAPIYKTIAIRRKDLVRSMNLRNVEIELPTVKEAAEKVIAYLNEIKTKYSCTYGITSLHTDLFLIRNVDKELELFNAIINDKETPFKMPECLSGVKEEDIYNIPIYQIIRFYDVVQDLVTRVEDKEAASAKVLKYKASALDFTEEVKDVSKWNIPIILASEGKPDRRLEITKKDLDGGGYRWFKMENVRDVGFGTMSYLCVKRLEDLTVQLSPLTEVFPFESCDIYVSVKAEGHSFGGDEEAEDAFYFDRFIIVRRS